MPRSSKASAATPRAIALGVLLLSACGERPQAPAPAPDFVVHGVGVLVRSEAPFAGQADLAARVEGTIAAALDYWGGSWDSLDGLTVTLEGAPTVECRGASQAIGCYDGDIRVSTSDFGATFECVEQTALVHEVGHAVIGDPGHADPRWMDFEPVALALDGRAGYDGATPTACRVALSVWRHPPDRP